MQKAALYTAAMIFILVTIAHAARLLAGFEIVIDGTVVPQWVSIPGVAVAALLAIWMVAAGRRV